MHLVPDPITTATSRSVTANSQGGASCGSELSHSIISFTCRLSRAHALGPGDEAHLEAFAWEAWSLIPAGGVITEQVSTQLIKMPRPTLVKMHVCHLCAVDSYIYCVHPGLQQMP